MRCALFILASCLPASLAASPALAADGVRGRSALSTVDEPWIPCADGDCVRSYAPSLSPAPRPKWQVTVAVYLWATDIDGTSNVDGAPTDFDAAFSDLFDEIDSAFMGYAEVQHDRWSFAVDASFLSLEQSWTGLRGVPVTLEVDQTIVDLRLRYTVLCRQVGSSQWGCCCHPRHLTLDAVVGARYWDFEQELTSTLATTGAPVSVNGDDDWWDPYVGARFRWQLAKRWGLSLCGDVGGFGIEAASDLTWELQVMVPFHVTRGFFLAAGYRALDIDRVTGSGATKNGIDATYHGPVLGLGYRF